jgi:hypothetical protein
MFREILEETYNTGKKIAEKVDEYCIKHLCNMLQIDFLEGCHVEIVSKNHGKLQ